MNRKKMLIATLAIALLAGTAYAALYKSVTTNPVSVVGLSDQLDLFVTQPYNFISPEATTADTVNPGPVSQMVAGKTYTIYLGVKNMLDELSGDTYMVYVWDAGANDFLLEYLAAYTEANIHPDSPDMTGNVIKWYEWDFDYDGYVEVVGYCPQDPYNIPASYWFVTEMWFTLSDSIPTLTGGITLTVNEYNSFTSAATGTPLPDVQGLPYTGMNKDWTYSWIG